MKIISWNCAMKFREKVSYMSDYDADVIVVQESENLEKLGTSIPGQYSKRVWIGSNPHKGLLVLAKDNYQIEEYDSYPDEYKYILPVKISGGGFNFNLFAVWAQNSSYKPSAYIGQVWLALNQHRDLLADETMIIGDFNSSKLWDLEYPRIATHSQVVEWLDTRNIKSLYHHVYGEIQGSETRKTFYLWRNLDRAFHIDYCFVSRGLLKKCSKFDIPGPGEYVERFKKKSDHVPLIVEFDWSAAGRPNG